MWSNRKQLKRDMKNVLLMNEIYKKRISCNYISKSERVKKKVKGFKSANFER